MTPVLTKPVLVMRDIHLSDRKYEILKAVDFDLYPGEIHALVGEHRAGKSTLIKILTGAAKHQRGTIRLYGKTVHGFTPAESMRQKISVVYQELSVIPTMDAVENIFLGQPLTLKESTYDYQIKKARSAMHRLGVDVDLTRPLEQLSKDQQIMVEMARALSIEPDILILDEISRKATPANMVKIQKVMAELKRQGASVIYLSSNIDEIFEFADRVTILKDGQSVGTEPVQNLDKIKLINMTYSFVLNREELKQENKELYFFKKYNEEIIRNLSVGVMVLNEKSELYLLNKAARSIFSVKHGDQVQLILKEILNGFALPEAHEIANCIETKTNRTWEDVHYAENVVLRVSCLPFTDEMFQGMGTILLLEDVSEQRRFEEYLLRTEKISSIAELAAGVAHEINNPLAIISNYIKLLQQQMEKKKNLVILEKVDAELHRIVDVIDGLLSFSKVQSLSNSRIEMHRLADEVLTLLNHKFIEIDLEPKINWSAQPATELYVNGQENLLKQVLMNLIVNACDAMPHDGWLQVVIEANDSRGFVDISVEDSGPGIPEQDVEKIFSPFFSTKKNKKNAGLGLPICQHIVDAHHGLILLNQDNGTKFTVRLPLSDSIGLS